MSTTSQPRQIPHGTDGGYSNHRCRCELCRAAHSAKMREYYARRHGKAQPKSVPAPMRPGRPDCGRPYDVLRYIDYCLDPKRPFVLNLNGGPGEMHRALREALAGMWAAEERLRNAQAVVDAQEKLVEALTELEGLHG